MEIRIRRRMTGREELAYILRKYGSRESVQERAAAGDIVADEYAELLEVFDQDPSLLDEVNTIEDVFEVDENDLSKLTATRLHIVEVLKGLGEASLKELTLALGRDKKNVSEDVAILESYGLVDARRHGKEKRVWVNANEVTFAF